MVIEQRWLNRDKCPGKENKDKRGAADENCIDDCG